MFKYTVKTKNPRNRVFLFKNKIIQGNNMNINDWLYRSPHPKHREEKPQNVKNYKLGNTRRSIDDLKERRKFDKEFNYLD